MKRKKSKKPDLTKKAREAAKEENQPQPKHCDDYIDDETQPECLRKFLDRAREPGHGHLNAEPFPELYADFEGKRVRVTMASRLGSIGWTENLTQDIGYSNRGWVEQLTNFGDKP